MNTTWIVVADASRARIFQADKPNGDLTEIETLAHPESRLHEGDLISDNQSGRDANSTSGTHSFGSGGEAKTEEGTRFASEICQHLEQGHNHASYAKFYLVAPPAFLGLLRQHLPKALHGLSGGDIAKDLTTENIAQIRAQLPEHL